METKMLNLTSIKNKAFVLGVLLLVNAVLFAQKQTKFGYIRDSATQKPLNNVLVTNENTHKLSQTDENGFFRIETRPGELIFFNAPDYHFDTIRYGTMTPDTPVIYLAQLPHELLSVTVSAQGYTRYQQDSIKRRQDFVQDAGGDKMKLMSESNSGAGLAVNLDAILKKKDKSERGAYRTFDEIEEADYIDSRFSHDIVAYYTGLQGDVLDDFVEMYRPTYVWLRKHPTDDDVFYYINDVLKKHYKNKQFVE